jgi:hypothetical protein
VTGGYRVAKGKAAAGAAGGFLKKLLGDLIRPVKKRFAKSADEVAGAGKKTATRRLPLSKKDAMDAARKERDKLHDELAGKTKAERKEWLRNREDVGRKPSKNGPGVVTGATDPETGISKAGTNHASANPPRGGCAEDDALDRINAERAAMTPPKEPLNRNQVYYSEASTLDQPPGEMPICNRNCQEVTVPKQYPDGVAHMSPGRWDEPGRSDLPGGIG